MNWTLRRFQVVTVGVIAAVSTAFWVGTAISAGRSADGNLSLLVLSTGLWAGSALLVLNRWWSTTGYGSSALDAPEALLAVAVALMPGRRREWGLAMLAEMAEVRDRAARWRFALSSVRATLLLRPAGGWGVTAALAVLVVFAVGATGPALATSMPELGVFAAGFVGAFGALVTVTVARSARVQVAPLPALLVTAAVVAAVALTVEFLRRDPGAVTQLAPTSAVLLAAVLGGCVWWAVASPRPARPDRTAPRVGVGAALVCGAALLLLIRTAYDSGLPEPVRAAAGLLGALWIVLGPSAALFVAALLGARAGRSFRAGVRAGIWVALACAPLIYAVWLHESLRIYADLAGDERGGLLLFGDGVSPAENLSAARNWLVAVLVVVPVAVLGAELGSRLRRPPPGSVPSPSPTPAVEP